VLAPRPPLGDVDIVVAVVVAVGGLSPVARETAAPDVAGGLPVNSSFRILDLRSSNSSQTVDGAVVDVVPSSVLSAAAMGGSGVFSGSATLPTSGEELYIRGVEKDDRFDCRYAWLRTCDPPVDSGIDGLLPELDCVSYVGSRVLKILGVAGVDLVADGG
jgi:hypothetical protein